MLKSSQDVKIKDNALFNEMRKRFKEIGANSWVCSGSQGKASNCEIELFDFTIAYLIKNENKLSGILSSIGNFFVEIRCSQFVFIEKITLVKFIIEKPV